MKQCEEWKERRGKHGGKCDEGKCIEGKTDEIGNAKKGEELKKRR